MMERSNRFALYSKDIIAGTTAGVAVVAVGHPFDTLKVLLQAQPRKNPPLYTGVIDAFKVSCQRFPVRIE